MKINCVKWQKRRSGINRYIMECKFYLPGAGLSAGTELIDTLWNVN